MEKSEAKALSIKMPIVANPMYVIYEPKMKELLDRVTNEFMYALLHQKMGN
jgi:hypothetical protein